MRFLFWQRLSATLLAAGLLASVACLTAAQAQADVGVERVSRPAGVPGAAVVLTIGCGACYPPCDRVAGRRGGFCSPGAKAPPRSFPVSLVPVGKAPRPHRCGPDALCPPRAPRPLRRAPFTFLGLATPAVDGDGRGHSGGGHVPRYLLRFPVPELRPGLYTFVIYCEPCLRGRGGSLIADPTDPRWQLRVRPPKPDQP